jgi:hypothetical protein
MVIRYKSLERKGPAKATSGAKEEKKPNDKIMDNVWKIMKYTQGNNEKKLNMKLYMPVFVHIHTLGDQEEEKEVEDEKEQEVEIKIMVTLPPEYQIDPKDPNKTPQEPPKPLDTEIEFEVVEEFNCYVNNFSGFAGDNEFKSETDKLKNALKEKNVKYDVNKCICISYDPPYKLFGRKNEVILIAA